MNRAHRRFIGPYIINLQISLYCRKYRSHSAHSARYFFTSAIVY